MCRYLRPVVAAVLLATMSAATTSLAAQGKPAPAEEQEPAPAPNPEPPDDSPEPVEPPEQEVIEISGGERLAWNQMADSREELDGLRYVAYIDFEPEELHEVDCFAAPGPDGFECHAPLPDLTPGQHDIQLAAYTVQDEVRLEGFRSAPIVVRLGSSEARRSMSTASTGSTDTVATLDPGVTTVLSGLDDPTDIAALPDGRLLIAERAGRIRVVREGALLPAPAVILDDVTTGGGRGLLSMAVDRTFEQTGHVYALFSTPSGVALARMTAVGDSLGARAILLDGLPVSGLQPSALVRMGPDGKVYVALDSQGNPGSVQDLGSYSGKILRLNPDGTTPDDQPSHSPVYRAGLDEPAGLAWSGDLTTLWLAGRDGMSRDRLDAIPSDRVGVPGTLRLTLPAGTRPSAVVLYNHPAHPDMRGDLLVASMAKGGVIRVRFDAGEIAGPQGLLTGAIVGTEWLLTGELGSVRAMAIAPDGVIYAISSDTLFRVTVR